MSRKRFESLPPSLHDLVGGAVARISTESVVVLGRAVGAGGVPRSALRGRYA